MISGLFWDASALVKAYTDEDGTPNVKGALGIHNVWGFVTDFVVLEVITALGKKLRSGQIPKQRYRAALNTFRGDLQSEFNHLVVEDRTVEQLHQLAEKYQRLGTSALDILHLASASQAAAICHPRTAGAALRGQAADRGCARGRSRRVQSRNAPAFRPSLGAGPAVGLKRLRRSGSPRRKYRHCRDETAYLLSSPENARRLMAAIREVEGGDAVHGSADQARSRIGCR